VQKLVLLTVGGLSRLSQCLPSKPKSHSEVAESGRVRCAHLASVNTSAGLNAEARALRLTRKPKQVAMRFEHTQGNLNLNQDRYGVCIHEAGQTAVAFRLYDYAGHDECVVTNENSPYIDSTLALTTPLRKLGPSLL
jgi:hypothetical protein